MCITMTKNYHVVCDKELKNLLIVFLNCNSIGFNVSGYGDKYYINMDLTDIEKHKVNEFLQAV